MLKMKSDGKRHISQKKRESTRARQLTFLRAFLEGRFCIASACRTAKINRSTFYRWQKNQRFQRELDDLKQEKLDLIEAALFRNIQSGDPVSIIFALKTLAKNRGYVESERVRTGEAQAKRGVEILDDLIADKINAVTAALLFTKDGLPLPRALELLLGRVSLPEPKPEVPPGVSDEELEAGYRRKMAEIEGQKEQWLPERHKEVANLKDELKNAESWGPTPETAQQSARGASKENG